MRLYVHMGLHKTASTYLQHLMNDNHEALLERGVYYQKQAGYPAHHEAAWTMLRGDMAPLTSMLETARQLGCHTTILSSEDLEGIIFDPGTVTAIEDAARAAGVEQIEWHMCLRDAGEYYSSLHAQLQYHVFSGALELFYAVMRDGMVLIPDPLRGGPGTPYWGFCFDHARYISEFAERTTHPLIVHDYTDGDPFPAWRMLDRLDALGAIRDLPPASARNARLDAGAVVQGHRERLEDVIPQELLKSKTSAMLRDRIKKDVAIVPDLAAIVSARFAASTAETLAKFSRP
ncbi:hypothetical protein [Altericroceibacterium xinjiangense]|uniref:hypothetical protein n=1 Tax=Altericroceibacterium xinjiangense TaxID=762261 RepID=UPI000F7E2952|nr:hypothetical protein [Altericroceibacterium xinjiangense]